MFLNRAGHGMSFRCVLRMSGVQPHVLANFFFLIILRYLSVCLSVWVLQKWDGQRAVLC